MRYAIAAAIILFAAPAFAQAIPDWDVNNRCDTRFPGEQNRMGRGYCLTQEQDGYNSLKVVWDDVDAKTKALCIKGASQAPRHNYFNLFRCVLPFLGQDRIRNAQPFQR